jgi:hypothetical protein
MPPADDALGLRCREPGLDKLGATVKPCASKRPPSRQEASSSSARRRSGLKERLRLRWFGGGIRGQITDRSQTLYASSGAASARAGRGKANRIKAVYCSRNIQFSYIFQVVSWR